MIYDLLFCFLIATVASFMGSLQLGPVNLSVIYTSYHSNLKSALLVAMGGSIPEMIYSACAFWCSYYLMTHPFIITCINYLTIPLLLIFGLAAFKNSNFHATTPQQKKRKLFFSGFLMGFFNPMLFAFWLLMINYCNSNGWVKIEEVPSQFAFIIGTATGAFFLLATFAFIVSRNKNAIGQKFNKNVTQITGTIFIILACIQCYNLFYN